MGKTSIVNPNESLKNIFEQFFVNKKGKNRFLPEHRTACGKTNKTCWRDRAVVVRRGRSGAVGHSSICFLCSFGLKAIMPKFARDDWNKSHCHSALTRRQLMFQFRWKLGLKFHDHYRSDLWCICHLNSKLAMRFFLRSVSNYHTCSYSSMHRTKSLNLSPPWAWNSFPMLLKNYISVSWCRQFSGH